MWNIIILYLNFILCIVRPQPLPAEVEAESMGLVPAPRRLTAEMEMEQGMMPPPSPIINEAQTYLDRIHSGMHSGISSQFMSMQTQRIAKLTNPNGFYMNPFPKAVSQDSQGMYRFGQTLAASQMPPVPPKHYPSTSQIPSSNNNVPGLTPPDRPPVVYPGDGPGVQSVQDTMLQTENGNTNINGDFNLPGNDPGLYPADPSPASQPGQYPVVQVEHNYDQTGASDFPSIDPGLYPADTPALSEPKFSESIASGIYPSNIVPSPSYPSANVSPKNIESIADQREPGIYPKDITPIGQPVPFSNQQTDPKAIEDTIPITDQGIYPKDITPVGQSAPFPNLYAQRSPGIYPKDFPALGPSVRRPESRNEDIKQLQTPHTKITLTNDEAGLKSRNIFQNNPTSNRQSVPFPNVNPQTPPNITDDPFDVTDPGIYPKDLPALTPPPTARKVDTPGPVPGPKDSQSEVQTKQLQTSNTRSIPINNEPGLKLPGTIPGIYPADPNETPITYEYIKPLLMPTIRDNPALFARKDLISKTANKNQTDLKQQHIDVLKVLEDKIAKLSQTKEVLFSGANQVTTTKPYQASLEKARMTYMRNLRRQQNRRLEAKEASKTERQLTSNKAQVLKSIQFEKLPPAAPRFRKPALSARAILSAIDFKKRSSFNTQNSQMPSLRITSRQGQRTRLIPIETKEKGQVVQLLTEDPSENSRKTRTTTNYRISEKNINDQIPPMSSFERLTSARRQRPSESRSQLTSNDQFNIMPRKPSTSTNMQSPQMNSRANQLKEDERDSDRQFHFLINRTDKPRQVSPSVNESPLPRLRPNHEDLPISRQVTQAKKRTEVLNQFRLKPSTFPSSMGSISQTGRSKWERRRQTIENLPKLTDAERKKTVFSLQYKKPKSETYASFSRQIARQGTEPTTSKPTTQAPALAPLWRPYVYQELTTQSPIPTTERPSNILSLSKSMDVSNLVPTKRSDIITESNYEVSPTTIDVEPLLQSLRSSRPDVPPQSLLQEILRSGNPMEVIDQSNPQQSNSPQDVNILDIPQSVSELQSPAQARPWDFTRLSSPDMPTINIGDPGAAGQDIVNVQIGADQLQDLLRVYSENQQPTSASVPIADVPSARDDPFSLDSFSILPTDSIRRAINPTSIPGVTIDSIPVPKQNIEPSPPRPNDPQLPLEPNPSQLVDYVQNAFTYEQLVDLLAQAISKKQQPAENQSVSQASLMATLQDEAAKGQQQEPRPTTVPNTTPTPKVQNPNPGVDKQPPDTGASATQNPNTSLLLLNALKDLTKLISSMKPAQTNARPMIPAQTNPRPMIPAQTNPRPMPPAQTNPIPMKPAQTNARPRNGPIQNQNLNPVPVPNFQSLDPRQISTPDSNIQMGMVGDPLQDPFKISSQDPMTINSSPDPFNVPNLDSNGGMTAREILARERTNPFFRSNNMATVQINQGSSAQDTGPAFSDKMSQVPENTGFPFPASQTSSMYDLQQQPMMSAATNALLNPSLKMSSQMPDQSGGANPSYTTFDNNGIPQTSLQSGFTDTTFQNLPGQAGFFQPSERPNTSFDVNSQQFQNADYHQQAMMQQAMEQQVMEQQSLMQQSMGQSATAQSVYGHNQMMHPTMSESSMGQSAMAQSVHGQHSMMHPTMTESSMRQSHMGQSLQSMMHPTMGESSMMHQGMDHSMAQNSMGQSSMMHPTMEQSTMVQQQMNSMTASDQQMLALQQHYATNGGGMVMG